MRQDKPDPIVQNITIQPPYESRDYRRELWIGVAIGVASAINSSSKESPGKWADEALKDYDVTFKGFHS